MYFRKSQREHLKTQSDMPLNTFTSSVTLFRQPFYLTIGLLQDVVTWYRKHYAGTQVDSGTSNTKELVPVQPVFVSFWKSHMCNLRLRIIYSVPCDCMVQRAHSLNTVTTAAYQMCTSSASDQQFVDSSCDAWVYVVPALYFKYVFWMFICRSLLKDYVMKTGNTFDKF